MLNHKNKNNPARGSRDSRPLRSFRQNPWLLLAALLGPVGHAEAFSVQPMVSELDSLGSNARVTLKITNTENQPLSIELVPKRLDLAADGSETLTPGDDDILVFPPVAIIPAGSSQSIQVQYVGEPELEHSRAYRIAVDQVPVDLTGGSASTMGVVASINTLMNVVPSRSSANVRVASIEADADRWQLHIDNTGNRYARFSDTRWTVSDGRQTIDLASTDLQGRINRNLILPQSSLKVAFDPPQGMQADKARVTITPIR